MAKVRLWSKMAWQY